VPTVSSASQSNGTWRAGNGLATFAKAGKPPIGTRFMFTLNEAASVSFSFTQSVTGRKINGVCVAKSKANKHEPTCKPVIAGTLSFAGYAGKNTVSFQGRISHSSKLKPGKYTLLITATNAAHQRSNTKALTFTIVK
jgi:hypothetical protein